MAREVSDALSGLRPQVAARLREVARPRNERSVAVFDFDNTCILGDIGELFSYYLIEQVAYRYDLDEFWGLIDPRDGRDEIRLLAQAVRGGDELAFPAYRAEMGAIYLRKLLRDGKASAYHWAVLLHVGLTEEFMRDASLRAVSKEWRRPREHDLFETRRGERLPVEYGIRPFGVVRAVMEWLRQQGHEVWIVSATNQWTVEVAARECFGVSADRVVGNRVEVADGLLTERLVSPAMFGPGKVVGIERDIGVRPVVVFGDSETDAEMMSYAELGVLVDRGDVRLQERAVEEGWVIQPQEDLEPLEMDAR